MEIPQAFEGGHCVTLAIEDVLSGSRWSVEIGSEKASVLISTYSYENKRRSFKPFLSSSKSDSAASPDPRKSTRLSLSSYNSGSWTGVREMRVGLD